MTEPQNPLQFLVSARNPEQIALNKYERIGLRFNPFPKSGTSSLNNWTETDGYFEPINPEVKKAVYDFIYDSLYSISGNPNDKFLSAAVVGDYGSGKTHCYCILAIY